MLRQPITVRQMLLMLRNTTRSTNLSHRHTARLQRGTNINRPLLSRMQSHHPVRRKQIRTNRLSRQQQRRHLRMLTRHTTRSLRRLTLTNLNNLLSHNTALKHMPLLKYRRIQMINRPKLQRHNSMSQSQTNNFITHLQNRNTSTRQRKQSRTQYRSSQTSSTRLKYVIPNLIHHHRNSMTTLTITSSHRINKISMAKPRHRNHTRKVRSIMYLLTRRMQDLTQNARTLMINNSSNMSNISRKLNSHHPMLRTQNLQNRKHLQSATQATSANNTINRNRRQRSYTFIQRPNKLMMSTKSNSKLAHIINKRMRSSPNHRTIQNIISKLNPRRNAKNSIKRNQ